MSIWIIKSLVLDLANSTGVRVGALADIKLSPVSPKPSAVFPPEVIHPDDEEAHGQPCVLPLAIAMVAVVTAAVAFWAPVV
jgi:hypothetical protein